MKRLFLISLVILTNLPVQAADRVAYVDRQVVRYVDDKPTVVIEQVAIVVSDLIIVKAVPAVAASTFQRNFNFGRTSGHNCPSCKQEQTIQAGRGPVRGTHWHVCDNCKSQWYH